MLRNRKEFTTQALGGVDRSIHETKLPFGPITSFQTLTNLVPARVSSETFARQLWSLGRMDGCTKTVSTLSGTGSILRLCLFRRVGSDDEIIGVLSRTGTTDALYKVVSSAWSLIGALPGTGKSYTLVSWRNKIFILDGTNVPRVYDGSTITTLTGTSIPPDPAAGTIHQDRLILGGGPTNRDRAWFSNVLDETTFGANSYYNVNTGVGDQITFIGTNSITTSTTGVQTQLAILKTKSVVVINGTIGGGSETNNTLSIKAGCPSGKTATNTPYGLVFSGNDTVYTLGTAFAEPTDIGIEIGSEISINANQGVAAGVFYNNFYRLSLSAASGGINTKEWMLFLHPLVYPSRKLWYGPHSGDEISEYLVVDTTLYAARAVTTELWTLDVVDNAYSMTDQSNPRSVSMVWPTIVSQTLQHQLWDAVGVLTTLEPSDTLTFNIEVAGGGQIVQSAATIAVSGTSLVWDSNTTGNWDDFDWAGPRDLLMLARPRRHGPTGKVTVTYNKSNPIIFHNLYVRVKEFRHQQESD